MAPKKPHPADIADDPAWQAEIATARRLNQPRQPRTSRPHAPLPTQPFVAPQWAARHQPLTIHSRTAACIAGLADNLPRSLLKDISRRKFPPTATLDLHGLHEGDAWQKLMNWLRDAAAADHRCVLVITGKGKGYGPAGDMGLIKAQVAGWLASHPEVLGFHTAQPRDGGIGALYVYLRRQRL